MEYAQKFASRIDFADLHKANQRLEAYNAFRDPTDDVKLRIPDHIE